MTTLRNKSTKVTAMPESDNTETNQLIDIMKNDLRKRIQLDPEVVST